MINEFQQQILRLEREANALQAENDKTLKLCRELMQENLQLKIERDQFEELYTEAFELNQRQRIERDAALKEVAQLRDKLTTLSNHNNVN